MLPPASTEWRLVRLRPLAGKRAIEGGFSRRCAGFGENYGLLGVQNGINCAPMVLGVMQKGHLFVLYSFIHIILYSKRQLIASPDERDGSLSIYPDAGLERLQPPKGDTEALSAAADRTMGQLMVPMIKLPLAPKLKI